MRLPSPTHLRLLLKHAASAIGQCSDLSELTRLRRRVEAQDRIIAVYRAQRESVPAAKRPRWTPPQKAEALRIMRMCGESRTWLAAIMCVGEQSVRRWELAESLGSFADNTSVAHNRLDDAVRQLAHDARALMPDLKFGTRSITAMLIRHTVKASRSSIQRFLREKPPRTKLAETKPIENVKKQVKKMEPPKPTFRPLKPEANNEVWHLDITAIRVLWFSFGVIGLMDGLSRKCLALKLGKRDPGTADVLAVVEAAMAQYGKPQAVITDRGGQFQVQFAAALTRLEIAHLQGPARRPQFNGKVERLFKTMKGGLLAATVWLPWRKKQLQAVLDQWRKWYNDERPHQAVGYRTPEEVWTDAPAMATPVAYLARDPDKVRFKLTRRDHGGGLACCPTLKLEVEVIRKAA